MATYTVTDMFLEHIDKPKPYYNNILLIFSIDSNTHKIAVDSEGLILDRYNKIAEENHLIAHWIHLMSHHPTYFESIEIVKSPEDKCSNEIYLNLASNIVGNPKLICNSKQDLKLYKFNGSNYVSYDKVNIKIYDKDEAIHELSNKFGQTHSGEGDNVGGNKNVFV